MKKLLIIVAVAVVSFLAGTAGIYYGMPSLDPERAEEVSRALDSLNALASGTSDLAPAVSPEPSAAARAVLDSMEYADRDSIEAGAQSMMPQVVALLRDSVAMLQRSLEEAMTEHARLREEIAAAEARQASIVAEIADPTAAQVSQTLSKLEDKELRPILNNLRLPTLEAIYDQASARDRRRLMANMPTQKAAQLVARQVHGASAQHDPEQTADNPAGVN